MQRVSTESVQNLWNYYFKKSIKRESEQCTFSKIKQTFNPTKILQQKQIIIFS